MKIDVIVYNIHSPYIFVDCSQQESYGQLLYSIEVLRKYTNIPVLVFSDSKHPLDEFRYVQKHQITKKFNNVEIYQYTGKESQTQEELISICVEKTFEDYDYDSMMYISTNSIMHCDPNEIFADLDENFVYMGSEPYSGSNFLLLTREKSGKYLHDANFGFKQISSDILKLSLDGEFVQHSRLECKLPSKMVVYDKNQSEYFIPSNYWNCAIKDRITSKKHNICHNCCSIIKNPIKPEVIVV